MGGGKRGDTLVCSLCSECCSSGRTEKPSSANSPMRSQPCIASSASVSPFHFPPFSCLNHPSPLLATRLLLTLVFPNKPFMLQQFGGRKGKKNIYYGCGPDWRPHTDTLLQLLAGLTEGMQYAQATEANWDI